MGFPAWWITTAITKTQNCWKEKQYEKHSSFHFHNIPEVLSPELMNKTENLPWNAEKKPWAGGRNRWDRTAKWKAIKQSNSFSVSASAQFEVGTNQNQPQAIGPSCGREHVTYIEITSASESIWHNTSADVFYNEALASIILYHIAVPPSFSSLSYFAYIIA